MPVTKTGLLSCICAVLIGTSTRFRVRCLAASSVVMITRPKRYLLSEGGLLELTRGDLTKFTGDAIVNAANERMLGGGGVDGAIHRAAGRELYTACSQVQEVKPGVRCPTGQARITPGFRLDAGHVIHTVGPVYSDDATSAPELASAYRSSLKLANENGLKSIAFPAISCGVYGYPLNKAAHAALRTVQENVGEIREVHFFLHDSRAWTAWNEEAAKFLEAIEEDAICADQDTVPAPVSTPAEPPEDISDIDSKAGESSILHDEINI